MHYAIIGCIHGNLAALEAVLHDIRARGIERIVCLGDIVGFGPAPAECVELVRARCFMVIRGDHDQAVLNEKPTGFIEKTTRSLVWTRERLLEAPNDPLGYLEQSQAAFSSAGIAFHHGSPRSPFEYLFPSDVRRDPRKLRAAFAMTEKVCFHAHTHVPGVITEEPLAWRSAEDLDGHFHYMKGQKALVSVGSVGQPRDGDPRACYLEIQKNDMHWRRVEYDVHAVVEHLQANAAVFSSDLAIRLQQGR
ncbi:MAG: metallophosphoesterase family protein [Planctomycetes bacterium]|nr:metallophosphoesterase family protein [Planctomycetota bacterium]